MVLRLKYEIGKEKTAVHSRHPGGDSTIMKNILLLIKNNPWMMCGGAEVFVKEISKRLSKKYKVFVVCEGTTTGSEIIDNVHVNTYKTSNIPKIRALESTYKLYKTAKSIITKYNIDVINSHIEFPTGYIGCILGEQYNIMSVLSIHGAYGSAYNSSRHNFIYRYFIRKCIKKSKRIHTVSNYSKSILTHSFDGIKNKIFVVSPGVDEKTFDSKKYNKKRKEYSIICVSSFHKLFTQKRQDLLLFAAKKLIKKYPKLSITFIGNGDATQLKKLSEKLNLTKNLVFLGKLKSHSDVAKKLSETKIFAFPTLFESFGMVSLEAMSTGTVPVVPKIPPFDEYMTDKKEGIFVELSVEGFYEGIDYLFSNEKILLELSKNAILKSNQYKWQRIVRKYENMLFSCRSLK
ncbi:MAG: glycosyltransferase family 4 protein [Candidatus Aenigmarchaeota archaeon]|nr:glycosyltransferase family 4 protein [Candidatus Aenigmarchaeota archaeon]